MSKAQRVHNPVGTEIVYDTAGHILPGHESVSIDLSDPVTERLIANGQLIVPKVPKQTDTKKTSKDTSGSEGAGIESGETS